MKKMIAAILVTMLLVGCLAGCGAEKANDAAEELAAAQKVIEEAEEILKEAEEVAESLDAEIDEIIEEPEVTEGSEVEETEEAELPEMEETDVPAEEKNDLVDGMRPEFKEAMDSFEVFFEEYCEFMEKYADDPTDLGLLADYAKFMEQYAETMEAMEAWDDGDMNAAETAYYLKITGRINKMLTEIAM